MRKRDVGVGEKGEKELGLRVCNIEGLLGVSEGEEGREVLGFEGLGLQALSEIRPCLENGFG